MKCNFCSSEETFPITKELWHHCKKCNKSFSVTAGTVFHHTCIPIQKWFILIVLMTNAKKGLSSCQAARDINLRQNVVWKMMHKLRERMTNEEMQLLSETLEMDETYVGGKPRKSNDIGNTSNSKRGRGTDKECVIGIIERNGNVKLVHTKNKSIKSEDLMKIVKANVDIKHSTLITDEYSGYSKMNEILPHEQVNHKKCFSRNGVHTNTIESFWAIVKRGRGTDKECVIGIIERNGNVKLVHTKNKSIKSEDLMKIVKANVDIKHSTLITDEYSGYSKMNEILPHEQVNHKKCFSRNGVHTNTIESFWAIVKRGRGTDKECVIGIIERNGNVKLVHTKNKSIKSEDLMKIVKANVDIKHSTLITDEYSGYSKMNEILSHEQVNHKKCFSRNGVHTNTIESFWAIVKRGIIGQFHWISKKWLQNYLNEFCFKYNNRKEPSMFKMLLIKCLFKK